MVLAFNEFTKQRLAYKQMQYSLTKEQRSKSQEQKWDMEESHQCGREASELVLKVEQKCVRQPGPRKGLKGRGKQIQRYQDGPTW